MKNHSAWKKTLAFTFALAVTAGALSNNAAGLLHGNTITASAAENDEQSTETSAETENDDSGKAVRTIMLYLCGSDLETRQGSGTFSLEEILSSDFGSGDDVNFIVMTGGSKEWMTDSSLLYDPATGTSPEGISSEYNQIWEAKSISSPENPGKLVLLDGDGISGDGENARKSVDEPMCDPDTLKAFINYSAENFPAEKYDLILWDHGGGPNGGFGIDEHIESGEDTMTFGGLIDAFSDNAVTANGGKFDFINFDACVMGSTELALAFSGYADYYIASPESIPGCSQEYTGWLGALGQDPDIDTFELGKIIADDMIEFYDTDACPYPNQEATLTVINNKKLLESDFVSALSDYTAELRKSLDTPNSSGEYYFYDKLFAWDSSIKYGSPTLNYSDLGIVMNVMRGNLMNYIDGNDITAYSDVSRRILAVLNDPEIFYVRATENYGTDEPVIYGDEEGNFCYDFFGTSGLYLGAVNQSGKRTNTKYLISLDEALGMMEDGEIKNFLMDYSGVISDFMMISETGYTISELSDLGVDKSQIDYDLLCEYWQDGYVYEGMSESYDWILMNYYFAHHPGGKESAKEWLQPYIAQIADEVISPDNVSVSVVEGSQGTSFIVKTEDTHKRLIDNVSLTYTAELPVVEEYWNNSPNKDDRYDICPDLILGQREADVQMDLGEGEDTLDSIFRWFDNKSSTWEIESISDKWYAINDADGKLHVAVIEGGDDETLEVPAITWDDEENEVAVALCFTNGVLDYFRIYTSDLMAYYTFDPADIDFELELMPMYLDLDSDYHFMIPLSKSTFILNAENADRISLVYTDVADIPDIEDIDGDGSAITESLVITDLYQYSFDITDKLAAPAGTLISIADAEVQTAVSDGKVKKPVVMYNGKVLTEGVDYIYYNTDEKESMSEPGSYSITICGKGGYGGTLETYFDICGADDFATPAEFAEMAKTDYEQKTGTSAIAGAVRNTDGTVTVSLTDEESNVLDIYTLDAETGTGTNKEGEDVDLPQTGMSGVHKAVTGLAALMLLSGAVLVEKSRKQDEE
ncbi:MAG: hypothetical protein IKO47_06080 [Ruminococcus sp.]|nr:hypothetical protein [Ruminococcus sp.]